VAYEIVARKRFPFTRAFPFKSEWKHIVPRCEVRINLEEQRGDELKNGRIPGRVMPFNFSLPSAKQSEVDAVLGDWEDREGVYCVARIRGTV
jgi:hypothetical protein